jgi:hypothetical protein
VHHSGSAVGILDDIMQLAACQRILQDSKVTLRTAYQQNGQQNQMTDVFEGGMLGRRCVLSGAGVETLSCLRCGLAHH